MTEMKAKQLLKIIVLLSALFVLVLVTVILVQTIKIHNINSNISNLERETVLAEDKNAKVKDKIEYYEDEGNYRKDEYGEFIRDEEGQLIPEVKEEIKEEYNLLEHGKTKDDDIVFVG